MAQFYGAMTAEFAILSEIVANRLAFAASPATLAFSEEEIVMETPFDSVDLFVTGLRAWA